MDVLIRLYDMVNPASDNSIISREVTEEYLNSEDYRTIIQDKLAIGGKTHKDRKISDERNSIIGPDDEVLVRRNSLFYIKKIFTKPDSNFCWAIIHIYDPDNFSGELRDEIINLRGLLKEGTKLPCSVVIQAIWATDNRCLKIIRIKGVDFTLNPSFAGSGTEKLMSATVVPGEDKLFSNSDKQQTKVFSFNTEISSPKVYSLKEIIKTFGRDSLEFQTANNLDPIDRSMLSKEKLSKLVSDLQSSTDSLSQEKFLDLMREFITGDNKELFLLLFNKGIGYINQLVNAIPKTDPNYDELIKTRLIEYFKTLPQTERIFSISTIIRDRINLDRYNKVLRVRLLIRIYQQYYRENSDKLSESDKSNLEKLFISDIFLLIKETLDQIKRGFNISSYYQLSALNPDLSELGMNLSFFYRRLIICLEVLGFIPEGVYKNWSEAFSKFVESLIVFTFGGRLTNNSVDILQN